MVQEIINCLKQRNLNLNPPLDPSSSEWLEIEKRFPAWRHIRHVYRWFNGFQDYLMDDASCIALWSMQKILLEADEDFRGKLVIGDFLIYSDLIAVNDTGHIEYFEEGRLLAKSLDEFLSEFCSGRFDWSK
jgi:hypothetical protein